MTQIKQSPVSRVNEVSIWILHGACMILCKIIINQVLNQSVRSGVQPQRRPHDECYTRTETYHILISLYTLHITQHKLRFHLLWRLRELQLVLASRLATSSDATDLHERYGSSPAKRPIKARKTSKPFLLRRIVARFPSMDFTFEGGRGKGRDEGKRGGGRRGWSGVKGTPGLRSQEKGTEEEKW